MSLKKEGCPTQTLLPNQTLVTRARVGTGDTPDTGINRTLDYVIGPQTGPGNPSETCQFKLQALRMRGQMSYPGLIEQDNPCLACGRRVQSKSQLIP